MHRSKLTDDDRWLTPCDVATDNDTIILTNYRRLHGRVDSIQNVVDLCCLGQGQCNLLFCLSFYISQMYTSKNKMNYVQTIATFINLL